MQITASGTVTTAGETTARAAWSMLAFLTLLNFINFVDRQLISSLQIPLTMKEKGGLGLELWQVQLLHGYAFSVVYGVAGLFLGMAADRLRRPRLIAVGLFIWSLMTAASGLARNFEELALARILVGVGEATLTPAAVAMIADLFRPKQRSLASGLYYLGIPFGASFCLIGTSMLWPIEGFGWRGCFFLLGLVGLAMVVVLLFVKDPQRGAMEEHAKPSPSPASSSKRSVGALFSDIVQTLRVSPALALTMCGGILVNIGVGAVSLDIMWLAIERGFAPHIPGMFLGVSFLLGGTAGNLLGGFLGDRFNKRWNGGRLLALIVLQVGILPFSVLFRFLPVKFERQEHLADYLGFEFVALSLCCACASILVTFMYGPVLATVQELTPARQRATMVAVLVIGLNILGASLGALIVVWLKDYLKAQDTAQPYTWAIFIVTQSGLLAVPLFVIALRRYQTDLAAAKQLQSETPT